MSELAPDGRRALPPAPVDTLAELIALAQRFGRDPEFSRGGGGNASAKAVAILIAEKASLHWPTSSSRGTSSSNLNTRPWGSRPKAGGSMITAS